MSQVHSKAIQLYTHTYILFFRLCSIIGYYKRLPIVPWSFHFLDSVLHSTNFYMLMKFNLSVFSLVACAFLNIILFIYFWLCCVFAAQAFLSLASRVYSLVAVCRLLFAVASMVVEHRL